MRDLPASFATIFGAVSMDEEVPDGGATLTDGPASSPSDVDPRPPSAQGTSPRYQIKSVLGRGGMGEVRLCRDTRIGRDVAIKVAHAKLSSSSARARFLREARVQGQLEHPAIVPVHDLELFDDGSAYFAMKRVRGKTLSAILAERRSDERKHLLRKLLIALNSVCLAVDFAHSKGVIHRDIKPGNIMLGDFGEVYLLDWGLAKHEHSDDDGQVYDPPSDTAPMNTMTGNLMGTPGYMAPEQIDNARGALGPAADIYALGAVLFEIVAGEPYTFAPTALEATVLALQDRDRRPSMRGRVAPSALDAICAKALARSPADRFATARALHDAIDAHLAGEQDLERRGELSRAHLATAERTLQSGDDPATRALALHELGSALALDPDNAAARSALLRLLTAPPSAPPAEVKRRVEADHITQRRAVGRLRATTSLVFFLFAPVAWLIGLREPGAFALAMALIVGAAAANVSVWRAQKPSTLLEYVGVTLTLGAYLAITRFAGPLIVTPALLVAYAVATQTHPQRLHRFVVTTLCCAVLIIGFLLEVGGAVDPAYAFVEGGVLVREHMIKIDQSALWFFFAASLATIITPSLFAARARAAQTRAEESLHTQTWQLEQLVARDDVPVQTCTARGSPAQ